MLDRLTILFAKRPRTAEDWVARMGNPVVGARMQAAFLAWLESDPEHLRRYELAKAEQAALEDLRGTFAMDLARLRRSERHVASPRRFVLAGGLAVAALAVAAVVLIPSPEARLYESAPGQIMDVALDDGSRVTLDADSAIRVSLTGDVRRVILERGAAYFDVAHDATHPFQVAVGDRRVIVTGTRFVTALTGDGAHISLLQGRVVVGTRDAAEKAAVQGALALAPGERAVFHPGQPAIEKARVDVEMTTAWRKRRLVFQDASLSDVVVAAARYSERPLVVADPELARVKVTAVLPLEGEGTLVARMTALLPIETRQTADGRVLIRAQ